MSTTNSNRNAKHNDRARAEDLTKRNQALYAKLQRLNSELAAARAANQAHEADNVRRMSLAADRARAQRSVVPMHDETRIAREQRIAHERIAHEQRAEQEARIHEQARIAREQLAQQARTIEELMCHADAHARHLQELQAAHGRELQEAQATARTRQLQEAQAALAELRAQKAAANRKYRAAKLALIRMAHSCDKMEHSCAKKERARKAAERALNDLVGKNQALLARVKALQRRSGSGADVSGDAVVVGNGTDDGEPGNEFGPVGGEGGAAWAGEAGANGNGGGCEFIDLT